MSLCQINSFNSLLMKGGGGEINTINVLFSTNVTTSSITITYNGIFDNVSIMLNDVSQGNTNSKTYTFNNLLSFTTYNIRVIPYKDDVSGNDKSINVKTKSLAVIYIDFKDISNNRLFKNVITDNYVFRPDTTEFTAVSTNNIIRNQENIQVTSYNGDNNFRTIFLSPTPTTLPPDYPTFNNNGAGVTICFFIYPIYSTTSTYLVFKFETNPTNTSFGIQLNYYGNFNVSSSIRVGSTGMYIGNYSLTRSTLNKWYFHAFTSDNNGRSTIYFENDNGSLDSVYFNQILTPYNVTSPTLGQIPYDNVTNFSNLFNSSASLKIQQIKNLKITEVTYFNFPLDTDRISRIFNSVKLNI